MERKDWLALAKRIDLMNDWTGRIFNFLVVPLTLLIVFEVISRLLKNPTVWTFETTNFLFGSHFMLLAAYGLLYKSHISIDLVSTRFSPRVQAKLSLICYFTMFFPFLIVILIYGLQYAATSWSMREQSWSSWGPPIYPFKTVIPLAGALLLLQGVSNVIKTIDFLGKDRGGGK